MKTPECETPLYLMDGHGRRVAVMLDIHAYESLLVAARQAEALPPGGPSTVESAPPARSPSGKSAAPKPVSEVKRRRA